MAKRARQIPVGVEPVTDGEAFQLGEPTSGDYDAIGEVVDPAVAASGSGDGNGEPRKRRGRKPGSRNKNPKASTADLNQWRDMLVAAHLTLATVARAPEFLMTEDEAMALANATATFNEHYGLPVTPKQMALGGLIGTIGMLYIPRTIALVDRLKQERNERKRQPQPAIVRHMTPQ